MPRTLRGLSKQAAQITTLWEPRADISPGPVSGPNYGDAVPSVDNAKTYWRDIACAAFDQVHLFYYVSDQTEPNCETWVHTNQCPKSFQDYNASPSFGVFGSDGNNIYDSQC